MKVFKDWASHSIHWITQRGVDAMNTAQSPTRASRTPPVLATPTGPAPQQVDAIAEELRQLLADVFTLYVKTKNFHWHIGGPHFRDYHLMLDEQADQIFAMTDDIAERGRKIGGPTLHSIGDITRLQRLQDNDEPFVTPQEMLVELSLDNQRLTHLLRNAHAICDQHNDVATTSLIENWIDETERRTWFLSETSRVA